MLKINDIGLIFNLPINIINKIFFTKTNFRNIALRKFHFRWV